MSLSRKFVDWLVLQSVLDDKLLLFKSLYDLLLNLDRRQGLGFSVKRIVRLDGSHRPSLLQLPNLVLLLIFNGVLGFIVILSVVILQVRLFVQVF